MQLVVKWAGPHVRKKQSANWRLSRTFSLYTQITLPQTKEQKEQLFEFDTDSSPKFN